MKIFMLLVLLLGVALADKAAKADATDTIGKVWKLDFSKLSADPNNWDDALKDKLFKVAVGVGYVMTLTMNYFLCGGYGIFLFGVKNLGWGLVATSAAAMQGYVRKKPLWLLAGFGLSYALLFGVKLF